jgi:MFS family permease
MRSGSPAIAREEPAGLRVSAGVYPWLVVAMLWLVCFFNYADRQAISSLFPLLKGEMGLSRIEFGILTSSFMWVYAAAGPLAGLIADRFRRKTLILFGLLFWSLITVATALSTRYPHLVAFRALEGLGEAFYFPASMSLLSDYHGPATRSRAMSIHQSSVYAGTIAGSTVAGVLGARYGWRSGFYLFGSLGVLLCAALLFFLREPERSRSAEGPEPLAAAGGSRSVSLAGFRESLAEIFLSPLAVVLLLVFIGANFVAVIFLSWMPAFLYEKFDMNLGLAGFSATFYLQLASMVGAVLAGFLADRWARRHRRGRMLVQALGLLGGVPFIFLSGWTLSVPFLVVSLACFGFMKGMYDSNIWASLHDVVRPERRASAVGWVNALGWLGGGTAPVAVAFASDRFGMSASISAASVIYLGCGLLLVWGSLTLVKRRPAAPAQVKP